MSRKHRADCLAILKCGLDPNNRLRDEFHRFLPATKVFGSKRRAVARERAGSSASVMPHIRKAAMMTFFKQPTQHRWWLTDRDQHWN
jgi:hypothetical protein